MYVHAIRQVDPLDRLAFIVDNHLNVNVLALKNLVLDHEIRAIDLFNIGLINCEVDSAN